MFALGLPHVTRAFSIALTRFLVRHAVRRTELLRPPERFWLALRSLGVRRAHAFPQPNRLMSRVNQGGKRDNQDGKLSGGVIFEPFSSDLPL